MPAGIPIGEPIGLQTFTALGMYLNDFLMFDLIVTGQIESGSLVALMGSRFVLNIYNAKF